MFDLKRPCMNCPFRKGKGEMFSLSEDRLDEIFSSTSFQCHKTVDYGSDVPGQGDGPQQCAGVMAILAKEKKPNQIMQVAERMGVLHLDALDPANEAYVSINQTKKAHNGKIQLMKDVK